MFSTKATKICVRSLDWDFRGHMHKTEAPGDSGAARREPTEGRRGKCWLLEGRAPEVSIQTWELSRPGVGVAGWGGGGNVPTSLGTLSEWIFFLLVEAPRFSFGKQFPAYLSDKFLPILAPEMSLWLKGGWSDEGFHPHSHSSWLRGQHTTHVSSVKVSPEILVGTIKETFDFCWLEESQ